MVWLIASLGVFFVGALLSLLLPRRILRWLGPFVSLCGAGIGFVPVIFVLFDGQTSCGNTSGQCLWGHFAWAWMLCPRGLRVSFFY